MKTVRCICGAIGAAAAAVLTVALALGNVLPDRLVVTDGEDLSVVSGRYLSAEITELEEGVGEAEVKLLGCVKVKNIALTTASKDQVIVSGAPIGIKMFTQGAVVVGITDINGENGMRSPAKEAGLKTGDVIIEADGKAVDGITAFSGVVRQSKGNAITVKYDRNGEIFETKLTPEARRGEKSFYAGVWVRDSAAGIGTLTFYSPADGTFAGLGHPVCDMDTGQLLPLRSGEIVEVSVSGIVQGQSGHPGELTGSFVSTEAIGKLDKNSETGIYGYMASAPQGKLMDVAAKDEVKVGEATILSTVEGSEPKEYDVFIEKIDVSGKSKTKNMVIRIEDDELLKKTGGIVQGMSGSPIIQNGKLIGAITHVLINDPRRGYGIFIENMMEAAG